MSIVNQQHLYAPFFGQPLGKLVHTQRHFCFCEPAQKSKNSEAVLQSYKERSECTPMVERCTLPIIQQIATAPLRISTMRLMGEGAHHGSTHTRSMEDVMRHHPSQLIPLTSFVCFYHSQLLISAEGRPACGKPCRPHSVGDVGWTLGCSGVGRLGTLFGVWQKQTVFGNKRVRKKWCFEVLILKVEILFFLKNSCFADNCEEKTGETHTILVFQKKHDIIFKDLSTLVGAPSSMTECLHRAPCGNGFSGT